MNKKNISTALIVAASIATMSQAFAEEAPQNTQNKGKALGVYNQGRGEHQGGRQMMLSRPAAVGTVTAINGNTLTLTEKVRPGDTPSQAKIFTIDLSGATVMKNNATSSPSSIIVGDSLFVQGTVTGTTIKATIVHDGEPEKGNRPMGGSGMMMNMNGNGQPVIAGTVSAINGTSITITNRSNVVYTADIAKAAISKNNATTTIQSVVAGDNVIVQGTINGTSVIASTVIDNGAQKAQDVEATSNKIHKNEDMNQSQKTGFLGQMTGFFSRMFGF